MSDTPELSEHQKLLVKIKYDASGVVNFFRVLGFLIMLIGGVTGIVVGASIQTDDSLTNIILHATAWGIAVGAVFTGIGWIAVAQLIAGQERILAALLKDR